MKNNLICTFKKKGAVLYIDLVGVNSKFLAECISLISGVKYVVVSVKSKRNSLKIKLSKEIMKDKRLKTITFI